LERLLPLQSARHVYINAGNTGERITVEIFDFLYMHWSSVLIVLALLITAFVLYIRGEKRILNYILYSLITEAERQYGSGTGQLKKAAVIAEIYTRLPAIIKIFITEQRLS
jgi:hypothetical protein